MTNRLPWSVALVCGVALQGVGCGSSITTAAFDLSDGAAGDASSTTDSTGDATPGSDVTTDETTGDAIAASDTPTSTDAGADGPIDSGLTIDNVCARYGARVCNDGEANCCVSGGLHYNEPDCRPAATASCNDQLQAAIARGGTIDLSKFDACTAAFRALENACTPSLLTFLKKMPPCAAMFTGGKPSGAPCAADNECAAIDGSVASCDTKSGKCVQIFIVGKAADCNFDGDVRHICDLHLQCVPRSGGGSTTSVCRDALKPGDDCPGGGADFSCGYGFVCDNNNRCVAGLDQGASCSGNLDCASWMCGTDGKCTASQFNFATVGLCTP